MLPEMQAAWQRLEAARAAVLESPTLLPSRAAVQEWDDAIDAVEAVVARLVSVFGDRGVHACLGLAWRFLVYAPGTF